MIVDRVDPRTAPPHVTVCAPVSIVTGRSAPQKKPQSYLCSLFSGEKISMSASAVSVRLVKFRK